MPLEQRLQHWELEVQAVPRGAQLVPSSQTPAELQVSVPQHWEDWEQWALRPEQLPSLQ